MPVLAIADTRNVPLDVAKIRTLREKQKLTMDEAAKLAGFSSRQRWWDVESGRFTNIKLDTLEAIARALGVDAADLLTKR